MSARAKASITPGRSASITYFRSEPPKPEPDVTEALHRLRNAERHLTAGWDQDALVEVRAAIRALEPKS